MWVKISYYCRCPPIITVSVWNILNRNRNHMTCISLSEKNGQTHIPQPAIDSIFKNKIGLKGPMRTAIGKGHVSLNLTIRWTKIITVIWVHLLFGHALYPSFNVHPKFANLYPVYTLLHLFRATSILFRTKLLEIRPLMTRETTQPTQPG